MEATVDKREAYYAKIAATEQLSPLWTTRLVPPLPEDHVRSKPHLWDFDNHVRALLMEAGPLITAKEATRRVLTLENPGLAGSHRILESLYAGLQLILPGEVAPAHRHTPSALRFIMEGVGAYTAVSGERSEMRPGDFIITPSMTWHDHGHEGDAPVIWMDGLDIPMVGLFGPMFFEIYPGDQHPQTRSAGDSLARYGANMRPVNQTWTRPESPIFWYPYERSREALEKMKGANEWDPWAGLKLEYIDPTRGGSAMPTISTFLQMIPKGFKSRTYRSTENMVYSPVEGRGLLHIESGSSSQIISWKPRDVFAIPCWIPHRFECEEDAVLFKYSDRVAQQKLAIWSEERLPD